MTQSELSTYTEIDLNKFSLDSDSKPVSDVCSVSPPAKDTTKVMLSEEIIIQQPDIVCKRCGRVLTEPKSRILGMGPTCYKQYMAERNKQLNLFCRKNLGRCNNNE